MKSQFSRPSIRIAAVLGGISLAAAASGNEIVAANTSLAAVQAAVNSAADCDTVLIPSGTATWSGGISTTKQIRIQAQTYTPTPAGTAGSGATTRSVIITNNSDRPLFSLTTGNTCHVGIAGIRFNEGSGSGAHLEVSGSGSRIALVNDLYMQVKEREWPEQPVINWEARGGVLWNIVADGTSASNPTGGVGTVGAGFLIKSPGGSGARLWTTASTMGSLDRDGSVNVYVEDSTFVNVSQWPDIDDHGRFVARHSVFDGTWGLTHGFTSSWGGRHFEYYDNEFRISHNNRNIAGRYFWCRAGTGIMTDNVLENASNPGQYGSPDEIDIGDNTSPGSYPMNRQPGGGHNGTNYVIDPIYVWNETGSRAYSTNFQGSWGNIVRESRDLFVNNGAKPGYAKYPYPHPRREGADASRPNPPSDLRVVP